MESDELISKTRVSAVINTRNAEKFLDEVLSALDPWVSQIVVADMDSTDSTVEIARSHNAVVVELPALGFPEAGIPAALAAAREEWILRIDADEIIPRPLALQLLTLASDDTCDVVLIPRRTWLVGHALNHGSFGPENDRVARFFRAGMITHDIHIHGKHLPLPSARIVDLFNDLEDGNKDLCIEHFSYEGVDELLDRDVRYTANEVEQLSLDDRAYKREFFRTCVLVVKNVLGRTFVHKAWRDGRAALLMTANSALYEAMKAMRLAQAVWFPSNEKVHDEYKKHAQKMIEEWGSK